MWHYNLINSIDSTWISSEETVRQLLVSSHRMPAAQAVNIEHTLCGRNCVTEQNTHTYFIYWDQEIMKVICFVFGTISSCVDFFPVRSMGLFFFHCSLFASCFFTFDCGSIGFNSGILSQHRLNLGQNHGLTCAVCCVCVCVVMKACVEMQAMREMMKVGRTTTI